MDAQRRWIGYDTFKLIVALILLAIFIILLLQWGSQPPASPAAGQVAPATPTASSLAAAASPTSAPSQAPSPLPPTPTALPSPTATPPPTPTTALPLASPSGGPTVKPTTPPTPTAPPPPTATQPAPGVQVAAAQPAVALVDLEAGKRVRLQFTNLPPNTEFAVQIGTATVAHISSSDGGPVTLWLEIPSDLANSPYVDARIASATGLSATTRFANMAAIGLAAPTATATATVFVANPSLTVLHVQQGGLVIATISGVPAFTNYTVTVGKAGSQGVGGYPIAHLNTGNNAGSSLTGTFEIPVVLRNEPNLDLRLEAGGAVYVVTFNNVNF